MSVRAGLRSGAMCEDSGGCEYQVSWWRKKSFISRIQCAWADLSLLQPNSSFQKCLMNDNSQIIPVGWIAVNYSRSFFRSLRPKPNHAHEHDTAIPPDTHLYYHSPLRSDPRFDFSPNPARMLQIFGYPSLSSGVYMI